MTAIIILSSALWYLSGMSSFIYWWTKDNDLTLSNLLFALFTGLIGPFSWIVGYSIHGDHKKSNIMNKVVLRRRLRKLPLK